MDTYPVSKGGQTAMQMTPNAYYESYGFPACDELDGDYTYIAVGNTIYFSAYVWTDPSSFGDTDYGLAGGAIGIDLYGANGRICEISTPTGLPSYPSYPASMAQCRVSPGSNGWVKVTIAFTVASQYEADPWGGYAAGSMATPTACIPWFCWDSSNPPAETAKMWVYDTTLQIDPSNAPTPTPTATPTPTGSPTPTPAPTPSPTPIPSGSPSNPGTGTHPSYPQPTATPIGTTPLSQSAMFTPFVIIIAAGFGVAVVFSLVRSKRIVYDLIVTVLVLGSVGIFALWLLFNGI
jgi:hypothetical protein